MTEPAVTPRDAATMILVRTGSDAPRVLMGQRGKGASFMPSKFVFPGGALDPSDRQLADKFSAHPDDHESLAARAPEDTPPSALALAAIRETWEETGLALGWPDDGAAAFSHPDQPDWNTFFDSGLYPAANKLRFIFRAITPPTRSKRFDARFFMADASLLHGDVDDLSGADGELSHLSWLTLPEARALDLPFITEVVLAEVEARLATPDQPRPIPFFHHDEGRSYLDHL